MEEDLLEMASLIKGFFFFKVNLFPEEDRSSQNRLHKKKKKKGLNGMSILWSSEGSPLFRVILSFLCSSFMLTPNQPADGAGRSGRGTGPGLLMGDALENGVTRYAPTEFLLSSILTG